MDTPATRPDPMTVADVAAAAGRNQVPLGIAYMVGATGCSPAAMRS